MLAHACEPYHLKDKPTYVWWRSLFGMVAQWQNFRFCVIFAIVYDPIATNLGLNRHLPCNLSTSDTLLIIIYLYYDQRSEHYVGLIYSRVQGSKYQKYLALGYEPLLDREALSYIILISLWVKDWCLSKCLPQPRCGDQSRLKGCDNGECRYLQDISPCKERNRLDLSRI